MSRLDELLVESEKIILNSHSEPYQPVLLLELLVEMVKELRKRDGQLVVKIAKELRKDDRAR